VRQRLEKQLHRRARELGYELKKVASPSAATEPSAVEESAAATEPTAVP
jgi:hypothetical protein